jgi:hypothetical protein
MVSVTSRAFRRLADVTAKGHKGRLSDSEMAADVAAKVRRAEVTTLPPLTERQAEVFAQIVLHWEVNGKPVRASYLARFFKMSREGVRNHVRALVAKGRVPSIRSPYRPIGASS